MCHKSAKERYAPKCEFTFAFSELLVQACSGAERHIHGTNDSVHRAATHLRRRPAPSSPRRAAATRRCRPCLNDGSSMKARIPPNIDSTEPVSSPHTEQSLDELARVERLECVKMLASAEEHDRALCGGHAVNRKANVRFLQI